MPRKRLRPTFVTRNFTYACRVLDPVPQAVWDTARAMQDLWNLLCARHDAVLADWDADTPQEVKRAAYAPFWPAAYLVTRDEGERLGLSAWQKWHVYDAFRTAQQRWAKGQGGRPRAHHGLRRLILPHRTQSGGVPVDWLWQDSERKHTAILGPTPGHHWRDAYTTVGGARVRLRVLLHRPLPDDAVLKRLALLGTHEPAFGGWDWRFQCTVEMPPPVPLAPVGRAFGLDLGWRVRDHGLRVAVVTDGVSAWEMVLPWDMAGANLRRRQARYAKYGAILDTTGHWRHLWERQRALDLALEACKDHLGDLAPWDGWPPAAQASMVQLVRMRAGGLRRLRRTLAEAGVVVPVLEDWMTRHALGWKRFRASQHHVFRARAHLYRHFAKWLARHADVVSWEGDLGLKKMAEAGPTGEAALEAARRYRQMAGLSTLRGFIRESLASAGRTLLETPAASTTITCAVAGCPGVIAASPELELECSEGHRADQDLNAARVLWQAIPEAQRPPVTSLPPVDWEQLRGRLVPLAG